MPIGARADRIGLSADEGAHAAGDVRKRLQCLRDRPVVTRMNKRRGGEADEIELVERRALAVELGEVAEHSAAEAGARKGAPRRAIELDRPAGRAARGCRAACISDRRPARRARPGTASPARDGLAERCDLVLEAIDLGDDGFEPGRRAERLARPRAARARLRGHGRGADRNGRSHGRRRLARSVSAWPSAAAASSGSRPRPKRRRRADMRSERDTDRALAAARRGAAPAGDGERHRLIELAPPASVYGQGSASGRT